MTTTPTTLGRVRDVIEEELGGFRHFATMPAAELEFMAERLARAIAPVLAGDLPNREAEPARRDAA